MRVDAELESRQFRLLELRLEIASAEQTLQDLRVLIDEARANGCVAELLRANAALDAAIKASETDPLTQLPNRLVLRDRLAHDIAVAKRHGSLLAVYFLDLDGFKAVNDQFGHEVGDRYLQAAAARLVAILRASDTVCRVGGDEFIVLVPEVQHRDVAEVSRKILDAVATPCTLDGHLLLPSASIGASLYPVDGEEPEVLLRQADAAMYRAKRLKKRGPAAPCPDQREP